MDNKINDAFEYHTTNEERQENYQNIRTSIKATAAVIDEVVPDSCEKSLAMTKLEKAAMWANKAIAIALN